MIKPKKLKNGDRVALVSLSWGGLGDNQFIHKYNIAKNRLKEEFGLELVPMKYSLKGTDFIKEHPQLRAKDLMDAFLDDKIQGIFCAIGGEDTIRLLPYIDYEIIKKHPKVFMGYSDTTVNHLMMYKAGLVSYYGPCVMCEFGEYVSMFQYTKDAIKDILFADHDNYMIRSSNEWSDDFVPWDELNINQKKTMKPEEHGYEVLQGIGCVSGHLLGGCLDTFVMCIGTEIWPTLDQWKGAILFIETSEEQPCPAQVVYILRNLAAQGILKILSGVLVGKPMGEKYYDEYKESIYQVISKEEKLIDLPVMYNVNFGHAAPIGILPYGINVQIDCEAKSIKLMESATI